MSDRPLLLTECSQEPCFPAQDMESHGLMTLTVHIIPLLLRVLPPLHHASLGSLTMLVLPCGTQWHAQQRMHSDQSQRMIQCQNTCRLVPHSRMSLIQHGDQLTVWSRHRTQTQESCHLHSWPRSAHMTCALGVCRTGWPQRPRSCQCKHAGRGAVCRHDNMTGMKRHVE